MRNTSIFNMPTLRTLLSATFLLALSTTAMAQKIATWKGGTPGKPAEWNCPSNWEEGKVPNEFSQVIIPDVSTRTFNNPVLSSGEVEIWSILIHSGASLRIDKKARLIALEQDAHKAWAWNPGVLHCGALPETIVFTGK